jgi:hypothetical protein
VFHILFILFTKSLVSRESTIFLIAFRNASLKGIFSQDWGRLQMVLLERYRVLDITAWGLFFFKVVKIYKILNILGGMTFTCCVTGWT